VTREYLIVEEVARRRRCSVRTIHGLTAAGLIPHRRMPGERRCLFIEQELTAWEDGAPLETVELDGGGRIVRPIEGRP
jgi:hypothetical protein